MTLALAGVWAWLKARGLRGLIITGLVVLACFQQVQLYGLTIAPRIGPFHFTLIHVEGAVARAASAKAALVARVAAERVARAAQVAVNHAPAQASRAIAEDTNAQTISRKAAVGAAVAAYALAHPVRGCVFADAAGGGGGGAGVPGADRVTGGGDRAGVSPDMVAISRADLDGFADNTRALDQLRGALTRLVASGWAVVSTDSAAGAAPTKGN